MNAWKDFLNELGDDVKYYFGDMFNTDPENVIVLDNGNVCVDGEWLSVERKQYLLENRCMGW